MSASKVWVCLRTGYRLLLDCPTLTVSEAESLCLDNLRSALLARDGDGEPIVVVGGSKVNIDPDFYSSSIPSLLVWDTLNSDALLNA